MFEVSPFEQLQSAAALEAETPASMDEECSKDEETSASNYNSPNPLLIPIVLEKVFEYLDLNTLANSRNVCTTWKAEARTPLRKRCCVKFTSIDQVRTYIEEMRDIDPENSVHEVYQFGDLTTARCRSFVAAGIRRVRMVDMADHVSPYYTAGYRELCQETLQTFFRSFGNRTRILELDSDFEMDVPELRRLLAEETPNLESLSMTLRYTQSNRLFTDGIPFFKPRLMTFSLRSDVGMVPLSLLRDYFVMAPNLRKITCLPLFSAKTWKYSPRQPRAGRVDFIRVLFHTIVMAPNPPDLQYLTNLDINLQLTETELQGLIRVAFPLTSIKLGICSDVRGITLGNFLNSGASRFTRVSLNFHPNSNAASYSLYNFQLQELRYLCLCGFKAPITFIRNCPLLKTLIVGQTGNLARTFHLNEMSPHDLQNLFIQWDELEDPAIIGRITRCFPQLKSFSMRKGNDNVLREIYLNMPFLQNLTILGGAFTDEGITGVTEMVYKDIAESGSLSLADPGKLRTNMSIGSLSNLRKLHLESDAITDVSLFLGIGSCVNLQHLHLQCNMLTDYCLWRIVKFPYLSKLNIVSCAGLTVENKIKMKNEFYAQNRRVEIEWSIEEVFRESQRRQLILPDIPHDHYQQALLGVDQNADEDEGNGLPIIPLPPRPHADLSDSSDDDDLEHGFHRFNVRGRMRVGPRYRGPAGPLHRNLGEREEGGAVRIHYQRVIAAMRVPPHRFYRYNQERPRPMLGGVEPEEIGPPPFQPVPDLRHMGLHQQHIGGQGPDNPAEALRLFGFPDPLHVNVQRIRRQQIQILPPNVNRIQVGPLSPADYPPPIPVDLDLLDDVEM